MEGLRRVQLVGDELDAFLGDGGTGTLSFATETGDPPHSIPVSYGYDAETAAFYFRISVPSGSRKARLVDDPVTFVVHDRVDGGGGAPSRPAVLRR